MAREYRKRENWNIRKNWAISCNDDGLWDLAEKTGKSNPQEKWGRNIFLIYEWPWLDDAIWSYGRFWDNIEWLF